MRFHFILFAQASKTKMKKKVIFYVTMTTTMLQILIWTLHNILFNTAILKPCIFVSLLRDDDNWKYFKSCSHIWCFFKSKYITRSFISWSSSCTFHAYVMLDYFLLYTFYFSTSNISSLILSQSCPVWIYWKYW